MKTDWQRGGIAMARACLAGLNCVERGTWTLARYREWLEAYLASDPAYVKKSKAAVETKLTQGKN